MNINSSQMRARGCLLVAACYTMGQAGQLTVRASSGERSRSQCVTPGILEVVGKTPVVLLTSAKVDSLELARTNKRAASQMLFSSALPLFAASALLIYHENSWAALTGDALITPERMPRYRSTLRPCLVDLFVAEPSVLKLQGPGGAIEAFYTAMGAWEPVEKRLRLQSGKLLVRKVGAIKHAVHSVPDGTVVVWTDVDVVFHRPLDGAFIDFVARYDVTYCPMQGHNYGTTGLDDPTWRVESGVMAFRANARTRALTRAALELYNGGTLRIATACRDRAAAGQPEPECTEPWLKRNLFLNDIYVWALLLHGARRDSMLLRELVPSFSDLADGLEQAWFTQLQYFARENPQKRQYNLGNCDNVTKLCLGATPFTAPFNIHDYARHHMTRTGTYTKQRHAAIFNTSGISPVLSTNRFEKPSRPLLSW